MENTIKYSKEGEGLGSIGGQPSGQVDLIN